MTTSPTPRSGPGCQPWPALQVAQQGCSPGRVMVRSLVQHFSASRFPPANDPARARQGGMPDALTELVAGGFEIQGSVPSAALSRGHK